LIGSCTTARLPEAVQDIDVAHICWTGLLAVSHNIIGVSKEIPISF